MIADEKLTRQIQTLQSTDLMLQLVLLAAFSNVRVCHSFVIYAQDLETQNRQNSTDSISCKGIGLVRLRVRLGTTRLFEEAGASFIG